MKPFPFTVSPDYPTASFPWGKPVHGRTVCHVSSIAQRPLTGEGLGLSLPVSAWTITVYDDTPRAFHVRHESDFSKLVFTARSKRAALAGIAERCDENGKVKA